MAPPEALGVPSGSGAVSGEALGNEPEVRHLEGGHNGIPLVPAYVRKPCLECHHPLALGERRVHGGRCARARKTRLQRLRRGRARRW